MLGLLLSGIRDRIVGNDEVACKAFESVRELASQLGLLPYELAADDASPRDTVKICHAHSEAQARVLLTTPREPRPLGEDA